MVRNGELLTIYNSRNYQSLLAGYANQVATKKSTIVEIIRAYQPQLYICIVAAYLQQQKLLELTSPQQSDCTVIPSTIVEIIRAYQPHPLLLGQNFNLQQQKLLELTSPSVEPKHIRRDLQQQKLLELTSLRTEGLVPDPIYNSRNYQSLLAPP